MRVRRSFRLPVPEYLPLPRLHLPLIEPDVRICRIRLSDKDSCGRSREVARTAFKLHQPEGAAQVRFRVA